MTPRTTGYFPMKVNMRHLVPGQRPRFWHSKEAFINKADTASVSLAEAEEGDAFFLDENGNPTTTIKGDASKMMVVPYLIAETPYDSAFITVDASESDQATIEELAKNTEALDEEEEEEEKNTVGGSGGGCELGFGLGAALALAAFVKVSKKR